MAQQGNGSSGDQSSNLMWYSILVCGVILFVWWLKRDWITIPVNYFRYAELCVIHYGMITVAKVVDVISFHHWQLSQGESVVTLKQLFANASPKHEKFSDFVAMNRQMGLWMRFPCMFLLLVMGGICYFKHGNVRFRQIYNMKSLRQAEMQNWPQITPVVSLDLVKEDIDKGPWAMALTPLDFGKKHNILTKQQSLSQMVWAVDDKSAGRLFSMQLGRMWQGVDRLPIHGKALLVIFIACATKNRSEAKHFLAQIAASSASGKLDFTGIEEALNKYRNAKILKWVLKRHAYNNTVLATLLELARTDGVLASAEFLWLKPVDRRMWYMLNSVGRQTSVVEVSGVFSHWLAEKRMQRAVKTPMVKEAVSAYKLALADILYIDESELWQTKEH
ncbi:MAG: phosphoesterase [Coxiellaceae bacterium]|nr:phosphoesterase [Coxiellaceae bacterium]|tara:strand:+ start:1170 stop:2339 length:1170 start_codon:yes stop_codon:yes gene_type:complete